MLSAIPCTLMRGGTSKGLYFHAQVLPGEHAARDRVLLAAMGSPDPRQIDGVGDGHTLTSKVAVIGPATRAYADVSYLSFQVSVDRAEVSASQNCSNMLAGVGLWAIENGLVSISGACTRVRIHMVNTASVAVALVPTHDGRVKNEDHSRIDGVPGLAAAIDIGSHHVTGSNCGALLATGNAVDFIDGFGASSIDTGMPVVILGAADFGKTGSETPVEIEADADLNGRVERIRPALGPRKNLGDVTRKAVPRKTLVAPASAYQDARPC